MLVEVAIKILNQDQDQDQDQDRGQGQGQGPLELAVKVLQNSLHHLMMVFILVRLVILVGLKIM